MCSVLFGLNPFDSLQYSPGTQIQMLQMVAQMVDTDGTQLQMLLGAVLILGAFAIP